MAQSASHKFGQIIGELLEVAAYPHLEEFAKNNNLYLDKKGKRLARKGKKLSWTDGMNNVHDLDFVLERGGEHGKVGNPVAFIEIAWRRYTKHSRNKAQEIQGAIIPLAEKYKIFSPFKGVILAGVFTEGALNQLKSSGFSVLYFSYETVIEAFNKFGIDANFNEDTSEDEFKLKIESWEKLKNKHDVAEYLLLINKTNAEVFFDSLKKSVSRFIDKIIILPLYGQKIDTKNINEAIDLIKKYGENSLNLSLDRYEIIVKYNTGDKIEASFRDKKDAITFLELYS